MFDFDSAIAQAEKDAKSSAIEALILAPSGGGKSTLLGTLKCKTLYLYGSGENHGVKAAKTYGGTNVIPACFDMIKGDKLSPDEALDNLLDALESVDKLRALGIEAVVVDGASEIETLIRASKRFKEACKTTKGGHNTFDEPKATTSIFRPIITALKSLQRELGVHYAMTCILDVKDLGSSGEIIDASPRLQGFSVAESLVQQFGDVLVVGKMAKAGQIKYKLQFGTELTKASKEENGTIKRLINFSPRISGLNSQDLPPYLDADLNQVIELKRKRFT